MSQLSSTLKRYTDSARYADAPYAKSGYGSYTPSSYGATLAASFLEKEKRGFKPGPPASFLTRPSTYGPSSILDYDRGRPLLRPDVLGGGKKTESQARGLERPVGSGLSGGSGFPYGVTSSSLGYLPVSARSQGLPLTQKKSSSQLDLARDFSSLRASESYRLDPGTLGRSPGLARTRRELCALQGLYQAASRSEYLADYLENYGRKGSTPQLPAQAPPSRVPEVLSPTYRPSARYTLWEKGKGLAPGPSRSSSPGQDTTVSLPLGDPVRGWGGATDREEPGCRKDFHLLTIQAEGFSPSLLAQPLLLQHWWGPAGHGWCPDGSCPAPKFPVSPGNPLRICACEDSPAVLLEILRDPHILHSSYPTGQGPVQARAPPVGAEAPDRLVPVVRGLCAHHVSPARAVSQPGDPLSRWPGHWGRWAWSLGRGILHCLTLAGSGPGA